MTTPLTPAEVEALAKRADAATCIDTGSVKRLVFTIDHLQRELKLAQVTVPEAARKKLAKQQARLKRAEALLPEYENAATPSQEFTNRAGLQRAARRAVYLRVHAELTDALKETAND